MRALLIVVLGTASVLAQGRGDRPVFDIPKDSGDEPETKEATREDAEMQRTLRRLAGWPSERSRRAAERLIVQKERSLPYVKTILTSGRSDLASLKPGAAYVLGRIGERSDTLTLLLVAAEKKQQKHADTFLEAAWRLDADAAVAEAFRFFHIAETTLRREAVKFVLDRVTKNNLPAVFDLLDRRRAERPFTREIGVRLLDRLVQTKQVEWSDVAKRFYSALGDESPTVAARVMRLLAGRNAPKNVEALNHLITKEMSYWRQRSYAALALGVMSATYRVQPFADETIAVLRGPKGLSHPTEMLARASAALGLAQVALRTNDRELVKLLDRDIPILLIDAVGASNRHYRDFGSVMPLAYRMLRRITGQTFPDHAPVWARWWKDKGRLFRAKRELVEVDADDLPDVEVEFEMPRSRGRERMRLAVVGENRPTFLHGRAYAIPQEDMAELIERLRARGFFEAREADPNEIEAEDALVLVRVGDLDRSVVFGDGAEARVRDELLRKIDELTRAYAWQLWWDSEKQPSWQLFFVQNRKWFSANEDPQARARRLRTMITGAVNDLVAVEDRLYAVRFLKELPGGGEALEDSHVAALVGSVALERSVNDYVSAVAGLLVPAAGPDATMALIDALADKIGPNAQALLVNLAGSLPVAEVAGLAADERWKVRRAAVLALAGHEGATARTVLTGALEDSEVAVRVAAAEALARRKDPVVLPALAELSKPSLAKAIRGTAAYAYGLLANDEARQAIRPLLFEDPSSEVKVRAIRGLEESGNTAVVPLLLEVFDQISDRIVRAAAATAIVRLETPELVARLIERLQLTDALDPERVALVNVLARFESEEPRAILRAVLQGDDMQSADAAALGLARRWDDAALVQLIEMVKRGGPATRSAVRQLQILTSVAFDAKSYRRQAENYSGWATARGAGNPRVWFRDALELRGYAADPLKEWAEQELADGAGVPEVPAEAVPVLLRALRDRDWFIRRNASYLLGRKMGADSPGTLDFATEPEEEERIIAAFNDWWSAIERAREAKERG